MVKYLLNNNIINLDIDVEEQDSLDILALPELNRGFSDQKKFVMTGMSNLILNAFEITEKTFNFKSLILKRKEEER
jgi:hypothetical protein